MFDDFECDHQFKTARAKWGGSAGCGSKMQIRKRVRGAGIFHGIRGDIEARDLQSGLRQFGGAVAGAAACVEDAFPFRETGGESVARDVLAPQVVIHLAGNDSLTGELNQRSAPRGSMPELVDWIWPGIDSVRRGMAG